MNDDKEIDNKCHHLMICFFCQPKLIETCNKRIKSRKDLISYYKTNEITSLKNHVDTHHAVFYKKLKNKSTILGEEVWRDNQLLNIQAYMGHQSLISLLLKTFINKVMLNNNPIY